MTLLLTPLVREMNRALGMVDKPDPRRINKVPIPRGGGLALFLGIIISFSLVYWYYGNSLTFVGGSATRFWKLTAISGLMVTIGYSDDKFSLPPKVKLLGQLVVAFLTWAWAGLGFSDLWPSIPAWLDCFLTVCWITGAVNAFNLIDGLDGLASGLALIAVCGMGGALFFAGRANGLYFYCAIAGGLLGFLKYNYNPASVFLGDSGSMFIGFTLSALPLCSHAPNSFLVSIGVPLLAMGVPIFDTSLAILRRSIRHILRKQSDGKTDKGEADEVMTADTDHLHHRILRSAGLNQRKAAWTLYIMAIVLVMTGLVGLSLQSRSGGLWLAAVAVAAVVIFKDMARVELFDAGVLLNKMAHQRDSRTRWAKLAVPVLLVLDVTILVVSVILVCWTLKIPVTAKLVKTALPIRVAVSFVAVVAFRSYVTVWARAMLSNYLRLFLGCAAGAIAGSVLVYYVPGVVASQLKAFTILYFLMTFTGMLAVRIVRPLVRDIFYTINARMVMLRKDVSRMLVYGTGLRYRAFRRELVRKAEDSDRIIVGLLDDDTLLRNHYIGGCKIYGGLTEAPEVINQLNVDTVIVACETTSEHEEEIRAILKPTGVKIINFTFTEKEI